MPDDRCKVGNNINSGSDVPLRYALERANRASGARRGGTWHRAKVDHASRLQRGYRFVSGFTAHQRRLISWKGINAENEPDSDGQKGQMPMRGLAFISIYFLIRGWNMDFLAGIPTNVGGVKHLIVADTFIFYPQGTPRKRGGYKPSG